MDANLEEKLRKLLRLSESPNPHEAQLALEKAQELAMKYGYTLEELNDATINDVEDVFIDDYKGTRRLSRISLSLAGSLAKYFRVKVYRNRRVNNQTKESVTFVRCIGLKEDIKSFAISFQFSVKACEQLWQVYLKKNRPKQARRVRNDYIDGFITACVERLDKQTEEYGLMIVTPNAVMKVFNDKGMKTHKFDATRATNPEDSEGAWYQGYDDGTSLGQPDSKTLAESNN